MNERYLSILTKALTGDREALQTIVKLLSECLKKSEIAEIEAYLEASQENENANLLFLLGLINELKTPPDYLKTITFYSKAIDLGHTFAMNNLGLMYEEGRGLAKDYDKAYELYEKAIMSNDPNAMNNLAYMFRMGIHVKKNYGIAIHWYEKASELNHARAMTNLGYMYHHGQGVRQDIRRAIEWYAKAIKLKDSVAMNSLACIYFNADDVHEDIDKAIKLYQMAIALNNSTAMKNLADVYLYLSEVNKMRECTRTVNLYIGAYYEHGKEEALNSLQRILFKLPNYDQLKALVLDRDLKLKTPSSSSNQFFNEARTEYLKKLMDLDPANLLKSMINDEDRPLVRKEQIKICVHYLLTREKFEESTTDLKTLNLISAGLMFLAREKEAEGLFYEAYAFYQRVPSKTEGRLDARFYLAQTDYHKAINDHKTPAEAYKLVEPYLDELEAAKDKGGIEFKKAILQEIEDYDIEPVRKMARTCS